MANYTLPEVFAIEQKIGTNAFYDVASQSHIIVAMLAARGKLNQGFDWHELPNLSGTLAIAPIVTAEGVTEGVTRAGMYAAQAGVGQTADGVFDHVKYRFSTYRGGFQLDWRQKNLLTGANSRGLDVMAGETKRLKMGFAKDIATDLVGTALDSESNLIGIRYWLPDTPASSTNAPGGLAMNTNTFWRPFANATGGIITTNTLTAGLMKSRRDIITEEGRELQQADLILLGETDEATTGMALYSKIVDDFVDAQRLVTTRPAIMSLGYTSHIDYMGAVIHPLKGDVDAVAGTPYAMSGTAYFLNTDTLFFGGGIKNLSGGLGPMMLEPMRPESKTVTDYHFVLPATFGIRDIARNGKYTGLTVS